MAIRKCPTPRADCPYYSEKPRGNLRREQDHGCYSDKDHKVPQRLARQAGATALSRIFIMDCPENHEQLCRWQHDEKTAMGDDPLPTAQFMLDAIRRAMENGLMSLSLTKQKQIGLYDGKTTEPRTGTEADF